MSCLGNVFEINAHCTEKRIRISNGQKEYEMVTHTNSQRVDNLSSWTQRNITLGGYYASYKYSQIRIFE